MEKKFVHKSIMLTKKKQYYCAYVFDKIADLLGLTKAKIQQLTWNIKDSAILTSPVT